MTKVICLVGASGSGKTTVAKALEKAGYNIIQSYTTRQPREENEWGHTFIEDGFVSYNPNDSIHYVAEGLAANSKTYWAKDMIAYFNSYNSGHHYFATDEQVVRGKANIYIVDPEGAEMVHEFYKGSDIEVITVYLQVDKVAREDRMINRAQPTMQQWQSGETYDYQETLKETKDRSSKDKDIFKLVKCDYVIDGNRDIEEVKKDLVAAIER